MYASDMVVTNLKEQVKNPDRVSVFVDGKYSFSLTLSEVLTEKIKVGLELNGAKINDLKKISEEGKLKMRVLAWITMRPHSERELRDYLFRKKVDKDMAQSLIEWVQTKGFQDDESFARWFAEGRLRKNKSWRAVQAELKAKGISLVTIQSIASELNSAKNDSEALQKLIDKLSTKPRYQDQKKLIQYLISKGFNYSEIKEALSETA